MATTATNKQPLLVDRVFHNAIKSNSLASGSDTSLDIVGTNESAVLVSCTTNDGGIVEDLYTISRNDDVDTTTYTALFYLSSASDYLRPDEAVFVAKIDSSTDNGKRKAADDIPEILAPLPHVGSSPKLKALYIPKGKNLWVTLQLAGPANVPTTPIIGAQGGFY